MSRSEGALAHVDSPAADPRSISAHDDTFGMPELRRLVSEASDIGDLREITFEQALLVTSGAEEGSGGVTRGSWLLAVSREMPTDDPGCVLLLRVVDSLPAAPHHEFTGRTEAGFDRVWRAYTARVSGLFYFHDGRVRFAVETDRLLPADQYRVIQPSPEGISWIASFDNGGADDHRLSLGVVRFTSARAAAVASGRDQADVFVNASNFVGRRTAVLGSTRSGKSNTIKTIASTVTKYAAESNQRIGQVIFDPQGEYASVNEQDGTGLRLIGDADQVRVYRARIAAGPDADPKERRLLLNFFDPDVLSVAWSLICDALVDSDSDLDLAFKAVDMREPERLDAWKNWSRGRLAFYALLCKSGYGGAFPSKYGIPFSMSQKGATAYNNSMRQTRQEDLMLHQSSNDEGTFFALTPETCLSVMNWVLSQVERRNQAEAAFKRGEAAFNHERLVEELDSVLGQEGESWGNVSLPFMPIASFASLMGGGAGSAAISEMRSLHDPESTSDVTVQVWQDMAEGRLAIVDLSVGPAWVTKIMAERIVGNLVYEAGQRFRNGEPAVPLQVIVEEAHNLFDRGRYATQDPWVRIAKEGAKYKIGMVFATQEVTSIDPRVLANTHNWVISNLNSRTETEELAKYCGYEAFADSIRAAEDVGYVRMKTYDSPFIVPTQVHKFDHTMVNEVRSAQGLAPL